jgi:hypothetical protein
MNFGGDPKGGTEIYGQIGVNSERVNRKQAAVVDQHDFNNFNISSY